MHALPKEAFIPESINACGAGKPVAMTWLGISVGSACAASCASLALQVGRPRTEADVYTGLWLCTHSSYKHTWSQLGDGCKIPIWVAVAIQCKGKSDDLHC